MSLTDRKERFARLRNGHFGASGIVFGHSRTT